MIETLLWSAGAAALFGLGYWLGRADGRAAAEAAYDPLIITTPEPDPRCQE